MLPWTPQADSRSTKQNCMLQKGAEKIKSTAALSNGAKPPVSVNTLIITCEYISMPECSVRANLQIQQGKKGQPEH